MTKEEFSKNRCPICSEPSHFTKTKLRDKDYKCFSCYRKQVNEYDREWRKKYYAKPENKEKRKAYVRELRLKPGSREKVLDRGIRSYNKDRVKNLEKHHARSALRRAVKAGVIWKPDVCSRCGCNSVKIHGHHHAGYDRPLDVKWLCPPCHNDEHIKLAQGKEEK